MKVKTPEVKEDPELKRQQEAAAQEKVTTIQQRLSSDTDSALRRFGARQSLGMVPMTGGGSSASSSSSSGGSQLFGRLIEAMRR